MSELSPTTKALLRAARTDGPETAARAKIWTGVASGAAGAGAAGLAGASKATATAGTAKLFAMGALLGSAVTVGVAAMALRIGTPSLRPEAANVVHADDETSAIAPAARAPVPLVAPAPAAPVRAEAPAAKHAAREDTLGREAALVAEARAALVHGNAEGALASLRATHTLRARALEPEELSLEARALRALGRSDEAAATDAKLRAAFPDNALGQ